jgi:DNA-binding FadR family transcriptional regulator
MGPGPVVQSIERFFSVRDCSFEALMQVRELLEPGTAALAAVKATPEDIETLRQGVETLEQAFRSGDPKQLALADSEFHVAMANASGNQLLAALTAGIAHLVRKWTEEVSTTVFAEDVNKSHRVILQAIADGDPDRAREACASHMRMARDVLLDSSIEQGQKPVELATWQRERTPNPGSALK